MGCDIHDVLERCIRHIDETTVRARVVALMLANRKGTAPLCKRKADGKQLSSPNASSEGKLWQQLTPELWEHVAKAVPVTFHTEWVVCPFAEWLTISADEFAVVHQNFVCEAKAVEEQVRKEWRAACSEDEKQNTIDIKDEVNKLADVEIERDSDSSRDIHEEVEDDNGFDGEFEFEEEVANRVSQVFFNRMAPARGLGLGRNYNAFGLFSQRVGSYRSNYALKIKPLGCMREGWPADMAPHCGGHVWAPTHSHDTDDKDENLHSHSFCTLAGLFSVDWDEGCASTERSGRHFRPAGPVTHVGSEKYTRHYVAKELEQMLKDTAMTDERRQQLKRGADALIAERHSEAGASSLADLYAFTEHKKQREVDAHQKMWASFRNPETTPILPSSPYYRASLNEKPPLERQLLLNTHFPQPRTRGDIFKGFWYAEGTDERSEVVAGIKAWEAEITEGEADASDFRLLIAFDN